jgi:hypothetical protein
VTPVNIRRPGVAGPALGDDRGSMPLAMLLTVVGIALSAVLLPIVVAQLGSTRYAVQRANALSAANAGLDVALGLIRAANDGAGGGVLASLPCGPLTGTMSAGETARYQVTIDYLALDPQGQSSSWVAANRIPCLDGSGPSSTPAYAVLTSQGTNQATGSFGAVPGRTLRATYPVRTTVQTGPGGLIHVFKTATSTDLCMDAGSGYPSAGTNVLMQPCVPGSIQQLFIYNANLTVALVASNTVSVPLGMCLDAGTPHAVARAVQLRPCAATTTPQQQWIFNGNANFEGTADGKTPDGFCFNVQIPNTAGSPVALGSVAGSTCQAGYDTTETFSPESGVGTGAAGAAAKQLVNLSQFGRCLDVTAQNVGSAYLIAAACQQQTDATSVTWDQQWSLPTVTAGATSGTGRITTTAPGGSYCLSSPGSTGASQYVTVVSCPAGPTQANLSWTVHRDTGILETSYGITDGYGYCLSHTDPNATAPDLHSSGILTTKIVVATCSGSILQKWNAPPDVLHTLPLKDISET